MKKNLICILLVMQASYLAATFSLKYPNNPLDPSYVAESEVLTSPLPVEHGDSRWVIYLSNQIASQSLLPFDPIVLSAETHPPLAPLIVKNKKILARISLTDTCKKDPYYSELKTAGLLLCNNPSAPDRQIIDLRSTVWSEIILNRLIPQSFAEGFAGFCLCNLDACINLENQDPEKYDGMLEGALQLLKKIRVLYPEAHIMLDITGLLHKASLFADLYDSAYYENISTEPVAKNRKIAGAERYALLIERLLQVKQSHPVYTLDFWTLKEPNVVKYIYRVLREKGFCPYVAERLDVLNDSI